jgi:drug/metabolite transporter (DMT)-like permease
MRLPSALLGHLAALLTISIWGITFISTKVLLVAYSPVEILFFRLILAIVALSVASPPRLPLGRPSIQAEWKYACAGLCGVTLFFVFQNVALTYTLAANVSVLLSAAPLFTALLSRTALGERLKANFFLGFGLAIAGIILIAFNGSFVLKLNPLGDLLSILAAVVWAAYSILIKTANAPQQALFAVTRKVFLYGLFFLLPVLPFWGFRLGLERLAALPNVFNLLFLGVLGSALCFATWNYAVHALGPVKTSVYVYLVPLVSMAAGVVWLHEPVTLVAGTGMALILAGMAVSELEKRPNPASVETSEVR